MKIIVKNLLLVLLLSAGISFASEQSPTVNINTADADTIATVLTGVGQVRAESIVKWRQAHGPFTSADQLAEVKGVGAVVLEKNRERIVLE